MLPVLVFFRRVLFVPVHVVKRKARLKPTTTARNSLRRCPSSRCASAIQIVRPLEAIAEPQAQLQSAPIGFAEIVSDEAGNVVETDEHG
ncbi:MAG: hypothetical protein DME48_02095 [Verrucomicrobia bacterium]|nr:MAG: hypothetical protein DME48_02095 [Verrucomicrobiota bacterium]